MNLLYPVYRQLTTLLFLLGFIPFKLYSVLSGRYKDSLDQRLGFYPPKNTITKARRPRIWMHAASVGEVSVAGVIAEEIQRLSPDYSLVISTTTETGQAIARERLPASIPVIYAPVDSVFAVKKALAFTRPDMLTCIETEIWPNLFIEAHRMGVKTVLSNGRISVRSWKKYQKSVSFTRDVLKNVCAFSMIHEEDARRIRAMGAPQDRICVAGNAKYDGLIRNHLRVNLDGIRKTYSLTGKEMVLVAGSTRRNEEEAVLDAYEKIIEKIPGTLLFIAPRHIERAQSISRLVSSRGFDHQLRSSLDGVKSRRTADIVIMDTIGELAAVYGVSTVAFCGGSLVPLGGQNLLEAAVWGKPVFYGPSMEDFQEARDMIETAVGDELLVNNSKTLAQKVIHYLTDNDKREKIGKKIRTSLLQHQGAARKHAEIMLTFLDSGNCGSGKGGI
jgi:3-deoxy-D-manno-octulosonic-acid transferase